MKRGQTLHFHTSLRKKAVYGFLEAFSSTNGVEPSPHIPLHKLETLEQGRPAMVNATTCRLTQDNRPTHVLTLTADEDCKFYLMQDVDTKSDPLVKVKVKKDGTIWQRIIHSLRWSR